MLYAVFLTDNPDHAEARQRLMPEHLDFLERNGEAILAAGPLREADGGAGAGGLWLVNAEDAGAVHALVQADPFWPTGLRQSVKVLEWKQVFAEGRRTS